MMTRFASLLSLAIMFVLGTLTPLSRAQSPIVQLPPGESRVACANGAQIFTGQADATGVPHYCPALLATTPTATATPIPTATATATPSPTDLPSTPLPTATGAPTATAPPTATPTSAPTAQPERKPSAQLAWFWRPGADGPTHVQEIAQRSQVIALQKEDLAFLKALRSAGYQGDVLQYFLLLEVRSTSPAWGNNWAWGTGDYGRLTDSMFLRRADGSRLCGGSNGMCYLDPASADARAFIVSRVIASKSHGFDGMILDNLRLRGYQLRLAAGGTFYSGARTAYTDADFLKAELELLKLIRQANGERPLWANMIDDPRSGSSWNQFLPYLDGTMDEAYGTGWPLQGFPLTVREYNAALTQAETVLAQGKSFIAVGQGQQDDLQAQEFFAASWMLVAGSERASLRYSQADAGYGRLWLYDTYQRSCGTPLGPRYPVATGGWARKWTECLVTANPTSRTGTIERVTP